MRGWRLLLQEQQLLWWAWRCITIANRSIDGIDQVQVGSDLVRRGDVRRACHRVALFIPFPPRSACMHACRHDSVPVRTWRHATPAPHGDGSMCSASKCNLRSSSRAWLRAMNVVMAAGSWLA